MGEKERFEEAKKRQKMTKALEPIGFSAESHLTAEILARGQRNISLARHRGRLQQNRTEDAASSVTQSL